MTKKPNNNSKAEASESQSPKDGRPDPAQDVLVLADDIAKTKAELESVRAHGRGMAAKANKVPHLKAELESLRAELEDEREQNRVRAAERDGLEKKAQRTTGQASQEERGAQSGCREDAAVCRLVRRPPRVGTFDPATRASRAEITLSGSSGVRFRRAPTKAVDAAVPPNRIWGFSKC
jgi:hypothetical protein